MNTVSTLVGLLFILICILPFIFMGRKRRKREKLMLNTAENFAVENNLRVSFKELVRDFVLALDNSKKALIYCKITPLKAEKFYVNLNEIKNCKVVNISRWVEGKGASAKVTDQLFLSLVPLDKNSKEVKIEYFNADVNVQLCGELQSIEKWAEIINNCIRQN